MEALVLLATWFALRPWWEKALVDESEILKDGHKG